MQEGQHNKFLSSPEKVSSQKPHQNDVNAGLCGPTQHTQPTSRRGVFLLLAALALQGLLCDQNNNWPISKAFKMKQFSFTL